VSIDFADIQGGILRAYGSRYTHTSYRFLGIGDAERGRAWLRGLADRVTTAQSWAEPPRATLNVALTASGLAALGLPQRTIDSFSQEFRDGMRGRAAILGDDPSQWNVPAGGHVLVTVSAQDGAAVGELDLDGLTVVHEEHAELLPGGREHFGYGDGFAQPALAGVHAERVNGGGVPLPKGEWRPLALGEFILGYPDEETNVDPQKRLPSAPEDPLGRSGTYMVWRKLEQHVGLYRRMLRDGAALYGDEERLAAKIVGRWRSGAPLETYPDRAPDHFDARVPSANDFRYADDAAGMRCPLGAHIRRSNPRDALGFDGKLSFRHRIIRRGMPYGPPLPDGELSDDGTERGLVFVCFNASISRQFESIQLQWLNDGNSFHLGADTDFLLGGTGMIVQGRPPFFFAPQGPFVTTRGGEYLYVPGIAALRALTRSG
jgi:Dyp-type peroxidase family